MPDFEDAARLLNTAAPEQVLATLDLIESGLAPEAPGWVRLALLRSRVRQEQGLPQQAVMLAEQALTLARGSALHPRALLVLGTACVCSNDVQRAEALLGRARELYEANDDQAGQGDAER